MVSTTNSVQHSTGGPKQYNNARKRNKRHNDWKGRNKLEVFVDYIIYTEEKI